MATTAMTRWRAALLHLGLSALIGGALLALILLVWYPPPLFGAMGGSVLALMIIGVDIVIGPLLTLIVFRAGKKGLYFDLAVIGLLQATAFVYGVLTVTAARPVYLVARSDFASVVAAADLPEEQRAKARHAQFRELPWDGPQLAAVRLPQDPDAKMAIMDQMFATGRDIEALPEHYLPYEQLAAELAQKARPVQALLDRGHPGADSIRAWLAERDLAPADVRFLDLLARQQVLMFALHASDGRYLGIIPVDPN